MRFVLAVGAALLVACGSPSDLPHVNTTMIAAIDDQFSPSIDTVVVSQNITWSFPGGNVDTHNVTWESGPALTGTSSGDHAPGTANYTQFFGTIGTYTYGCTHHEAQGMVGTLVVCPASTTVSGAFTC
jgi:plastocyanin